MMGMLVPERCWVNKLHILSQLFGSLPYTISMEIKRKTSLCWLLFVVIFLHYPLVAVIIVFWFAEWSLSFPVGYFIGWPKGDVWRSRMHKISPTYTRGYGLEVLRDTRTSRLMLHNKIIIVKLYLCCIKKACSVLLMCIARYWSEKCLSSVYCARLTWRTCDFVRIGTYVTASKAGLTCETVLEC
jgi:hypothetical protein